IVYHKKINKEYIPIINKIVSKHEVRTEINNVDNRYFPSPRAPEEIAEFVDTSIVKEDLFNYVNDNLEQTIYLNFVKSKQLKKVKVNQNNQTTLEIFSNESSKGKAIKYVANKLEFKKEEIIVAGDAESDLTMFPYAGVSFAVGKEANETVVEAADYHVMTIEEL